MSTTSNFTPRLAETARSPKDADEIIRLIDSQLTNLTRLGSRDQWRNNRLMTEIRANVHQTVFTSEDQENQELTDEDFEVAPEEWVRVFVVEKEERVVGAIILRHSAPDYITSEIAERSDYLYVELVVCEGGALGGGIARGAGAALLEHAKDVAEEEGISRLITDCWNGNEGKLVSYFKGKGFERIEHVEVADGRLNAVLQRLF